MWLWLPWYLWLELRVSIVHKKSKHIFEHLYYFFLKIYLPAKTQYKTNNYIFKNVLQWNYNLIDYFNIIANSDFKPKQIVVSTTIKQIEENLWKFEPILLKE